MDKVRGPTSHDVVSWVRRATGQKRVGHCGTLDPMATGVLVVALGEATKLVQLLGAESKEYVAEVQLGSATDSGDEDGLPTETREVPSVGAEEVAALLASMVGRRRQRPPAISAIKVDGVPLYQRARRGEVVEVPERDVVIEALELLGIDAERKRLSLRVAASKGFYVRALATEIAAALGTVGHLASLRRTRAGSIGLDRAIDADVVRVAASGSAEERDAVAGAVLPWARVREVLPCFEVNVEQADRLRLGQRVEVSQWPAEPGTVSCVLAESTGVPVALVRYDEGALVVVRGFVSLA